MAGKVGETVEGWRRYYGRALTEEQWKHFDAVLTDELRRKVGRARDGGEAGGVRREWESALAGCVTPVDREGDEWAAWKHGLLRMSELDTMSSNPGPCSTRERQALFKVYALTCEARMFSVDSLDRRLTPLREPQEDRC